MPLMILNACIKSPKDLYSKDQCNCNDGFIYSEKNTVDFENTSVRRNADYKNYVRNHIFDYVKSPLHVTGAFT